ncbi:MAG: enoyl-CoA hydratase/isomerase family protein [Bacteroidetes bacterium]|nr:enoyl-CoA hydratase/isomerase family protein [Bacteroidota bacterium]
MELVITEIKNRVGYVVLNRPEKRNALSPQLVGELTAAIQNLLHDDAVNVIVLKSADKPFCAGAALEYLQELRHFSREENLADSRRLRDLFDLIHRGNKVFISQVEGPALAGGCGLATLCDFCYATPEATFGYTESKIGFVPALVAVYLQYRIAGHHMRELLLTGKVIAAEEAHALGLVNKVVSDDHIAQEVSAFAEQLCDTVSGGSVSYIKQLLRKLPGMHMDEALEYAASLNAEVRSSADCVKGIDSFLNKEKIKW